MAVACLRLLNGYFSMGRGANVDLGPKQVFKKQPEAEAIELLDDMLQYSPDSRPRGAAPALSRSRAAAEQPSRA